MTSSQRGSVVDEIHVTPSYLGRICECGGIYMGGNLWRHTSPTAHCLLANFESDLPN